MRLLCALGLLASWNAFAAAPQVLHTPGYESPVRAVPDDLLLIPGTGFESTDRVVYQAMDAARPASRAVPKSNTADTGTAPIVQRDTADGGVTVRLPLEMTAGRPYRLWVVTAKNEWSTPVTLNDPRPQWITPAFVYSTAELPGLGRSIRIVGHNLAGGDAPLEIRLSGSRGNTYALRTTPSHTPDAQAVENHVAAAQLPVRLVPDYYSVSVRAKGLDWVSVADQKLEVRADPAAGPVFSLDDPALGACHPDDAGDDSPCLARAIEAASRAGGGIVRIPPGHWDVSTEKQPARNGFVLPPNVHLRGAGPDGSYLTRHGALRPTTDPLLTVTKHNSVIGLTVTDELRFRSMPEARAVVQMGIQPLGDESRDPSSHLVEDIIISDNHFLRVGTGISESTHPMARLLITANVFGGYARGIELPGSSGVVWEPYRIDDTVVRGNRFIPGSYTDLTAKQGVLASGMGAAHRVDFSANFVDGGSRENLQEPDDPPGFRAGLFWNLNNSVDMLLIAENRINCPGDKLGDGEAIAFDDSGGTLGFINTPMIATAGTDWITIRSPLIATQARRTVSTDYYSNGHWVQILSGPGVGQTRRIVGSSRDPATGGVTLRVAPAWDIIPRGPESRIVVQRLFWQVLVVGNSIDQRAPPCRKSNLTGPSGGVIGLWGPAADVQIEANRQWDTDGIQFAPGYIARAASCPTCYGRIFFATALEIRGNLVDGEYDWASDCSNSGIRGPFGASATPESPPPVLAYGVSISHNTVIHADAYRGGGIDMPLVSTPGPPPGNWPFFQNLLIFHNQLRDLNGAPPAGKCHRGQRERSGIRLEGNGNIPYPVLYGNQCERVAKPLADAALGTLRVCSGATAGSCECPAR